MRLAIGATDDERRGEVMMRARSATSWVAGASLAATLACGSTRGAGMPTIDGAGPARWTATLLARATPPIGGQLVLASAMDEEGTIARITLQGSPSNYALHPWRIFTGTCESLGTPLGSPASYPVIQMQADGTGSSTALLHVPMPTSGNYNVRIYVSGSNMDRVIACGQLRDRIR
jgi:hypothetical protein